MAHGLARFGVRTADWSSRRRNKLAVGTRTPEDLVATVAAKGREVTEALNRLRALLG